MISEALIQNILQLACFCLGREVNNYCNALENGLFEDKFLKKAIYIFLCIETLEELEEDRSELANKIMECCGMKIVNDVVNLIPTGKVVPCDDSIYVECDYVEDDYVE